LANKYTGKPHIHSRIGVLSASNFTIGKGVCFLGSGHRAPDIDISGEVTIGDYSLIERDVTIVTHRHAYETGFPKELLKAINPITAHPLTIGKNVLICERATILPQVDYIGDYAIIGYGAILTKNVESKEIWAGNPAIKIGERSE